MALSFVASSAWVSSSTAVAPVVPTGTTAEDYVVICLVSKYEGATLGGPPDGWADLGLAINATRVTGNDNGGMRGRLFGRVWQTGDVMPSLAPTPNNVSTTHATTYRVAAGKVFGVDAAGCVDDLAGSPLLLTAGSTLGLASGDTLHVEAVLNGDVVTWGAGTLSAAGATFGAVSTNTADASTATGTDLRMRSSRYSVTAGAATANPSLSTALAGTVTNAVGVGFLLRIREATPTSLARTSTDTVAVSDGAVGISALGDAITVLSQDRASIADGAGQSVVTTFTVGYAMQAVEARRVASEGATRLSGSLVSTFGAVAANEVKTLTITEAALDAAGGTAGQNIISLFGQNLGGQWSDPPVVTTYPTIYGATY